MANQSVVAVPPNVDDPTVLRRFLSRLVEQLDIVLGNRAGPNDQYVSQEQLLEQAINLAKALSDAELALEQALERLELVDELIVEELSKRITALEEELEAVKVAVAENFVQAGYGGIGVNAPTNIGTVNTTFQTITGFDTLLVDPPKNVTNELSSNGLRLLIENVWELKGKVSLEFDEVNNGRKIQLRLFNLTTGVPGTSVFNYFVGRNQGGENLDISIVGDITASAGDIIQLQVGTDGDTFNNVVNIGSTFYAVHVSEAGNTLPGI
jgi:hypothetical protein